MANTLRFEIDTDASYTAAELESLQEDFIAFVTDIDGDADADTADVKIVTGTAPSVITADAMNDFIKAGGEVEYQLNIRFKDTDGVTGSDVTGMGTLG